MSYLPAGMIGVYIWCSVVPDWIHYGPLAKKSWKTGTPWQDKEAIHRQALCQDAVDRPPNRLSSFFWVAAKELKLSYHHRDVYLIKVFLNSGSLFSVVLQQQPSLFSILQTVASGPRNDLRCTERHTHVLLRVHLFLHSKPGVAPNKMFCKLGVLVMGGRAGNRRLLLCSAWAFEFWKQATPKVSVSPKSLEAATYSRLPRSWNMDEGPKGPLGRKRSGKHKDVE